MFDRIVIDPKIKAGTPVIKNTRIPIYIILTMLRDDASFEKIIDEYPRLNIEDIKITIEYAIVIIKDEEDIQFK